MTETIPTRETQATALAELALCETLSQTSGWVARWSTAAAGADGALLWAPHSVAPTFLCIGTWGNGTRQFARRSVPRDEGLIHELIRDRLPVALQRDDFAADEMLADLPEPIRTVVAVPLESDKLVIGVLVLLFNEPADQAEALDQLRPFLRHAVPALSRALRAERKTVGMLHAIERLTNLYDLSKAFTSTIDLGELSKIIVRKSADFANAEAASLWMLDARAGDVVLAATAINERYDLPVTPPAVGSSVVGDVLADRSVLMLNDVDRTEDDYPIRSLLAFPLIQDDAPIGVLVVANKRGRQAQFTVADEELLSDLVRQAERALHNAQLYEAEKKVAELDALLAVSREITSTLDLDRVLKTIVNASSALIRYDRCAIAILQGGRLQLGAVSGVVELNRKDPANQRLQELLQWVFFSGTEVAVTRTEAGEITSDRPETQEKFRSYFESSGMQSFFSVLLQDEEGKLGVLSFESKEPLALDRETGDLLQILKNQATVAVRNAQLYQQVPLAGFWKPLLERKRKLSAMPQARRRRWAVSALAVVLLLVIVPWRVRVSGTARVLPARRVAVTAPVDGVVQTVHRREGDLVRPGELIASLRNDPYRAALSEAQSALQIAESEIARYRLVGDSAALFQAEARRDELRAKLDLAREQLARTEIRAAAAGVILTPRIDERVGQFLPSGQELGAIGDVAAMRVEIAVPEADSTLVKPGQSVTLKVHPYPTRTYRGNVTRVGSVVNQEGEERFVIAESRIANPDRSLRAGMLGRGKINVGTRSVGMAMLRRPLRYLWLKLWPMLP